jgi:hypothetical protein
MYVHAFHSLHLIFLSVVCVWMDGFDATTLIVDNHQVVPCYVVHYSAIAGVASFWGR